MLAVYKQTNYLPFSAMHFFASAFTTSGTFFPSALTLVLQVPPELSVISMVSVPSELVLKV